MIRRGRGFRLGFSAVVLGCVGPLSACSVTGGDAPLPNGKGTISVDNPIERSQVGEVTGEGRATTARLVDALVGGGMVVGERSFDHWDSCMSAKQFAVGYNPKNGIRYLAWIYLTPKSNIAEPTRMVQDIGEDWETTDGSSKSKDGVFSLDLRVINEVQLLVMSPCYFVHKVGKVGISMDEIDDLGGFAREPWAQ